jgi:hypothetical protein
MNRNNKPNQFKNEIHCLKIFEKNPGFPKFIVSGKTDSNLTGDLPIEDRASFFIL